ncbi:MAG: 5'-methylthioadenosine/S-adenosylhomocysteine nucleosidase [Clostridia bacterium]|nr:5'-methylthioadenosine/S-adenosylhomocysteine nucleosidase [Clostridia bacterium]
MVGIVVALHSEAENVILKTDAEKSIAKNGKTIYKGTIGDDRFVLIESGIGKVNAALSTQFLIDNYDLDCILNFGSVGGIIGKAETLSYYAVKKCCQYDFDLSALDNVPVGYIQDYDTVYFYPKTDRLSFLPKANLATSDRFTEKDADIATVSFLECTLFDMEGGAIAQVCTANNLPLYMIKGVTDTHGSGNDVNTFYDNLRTVRNGFYDLLVMFFDR